MSFFQDILMWFSLAAATILGGAAAVLWCDKHSVFPGRTLLTIFRRLPWFAQLFIVAFVARLVVHGSMKTNAPPMTGFASAPSPEMSSGQPLMQQTNAGGGFVYSPWDGHGAWDDDFYFRFAGDWVFPLGTNHLEGVLVHSQGNLAASSHDLPFVSLPFAASLVPDESSFSIASADGDSYVFRWNDARPGRAADESVSGSIQLFRNGNYTVMTNGVVVQEVAREPPFPHIGIGQDDDWVAGNFANATEILSVGYADWVDDQIGIDRTNGLYKFTAYFPEPPPEATELVVGDYTVCVTNAGEYVFVLEKGPEYSFGTCPHNGTVEYSMQDDVGPAAPIFTSWWRGGETPGEWTVDGDWKWMSAPTVWGFGYCLWMPMFHGSPDVAYVSEDDFPMTFEAVLTDYCHAGEVSYHWTSSSENIHIVSPNDRVTEVTVDSLPSWERLTMTVEANIGGTTLTSSLATTYGEYEHPQAGLSLSVPQTMFVNNDDDNDDGVADCLQVPSGDDDIAVGGLLFHSDIETNATVKIVSISGFDAGLMTTTTEGDDVVFVFSDRACTRPVRENDEFELADCTDWSMPLYFNPQTNSSDYEDVEIVVRLSLEGGEDRELAAKATVISPEIEPICNETKEIVENGVSRELTYNPCGVGVGQQAYFKVKVLPESFPDSRIVWEADGGVSFVNGNTGREVCVSGTSAGSAALRIRMREGERDVPSFSLLVVPVQTIGIHAMIIGRDGSEPTSRKRIEAMIKVANDIYAQVGMRFYLASIATTNLPAAYNIAPSSVTNDIGNVWRHGQLVSLQSGTGGIECYFVYQILDNKGQNSYIAGLTSSSGISLTSSCSVYTLAHEIGHLCGAEDIYDHVAGNPRDTLRGCVCNDKCGEDWNGGCIGRDEAGARYYQYGLRMNILAKRLLMNGFDNESEVGRDITIGSVSGYYPRISGVGYEQRPCCVGFEYGCLFRLPICQ